MTETINNVHRRPSSVLQPPPLPIAMATHMARTADLQIIQLQHCHRFQQCNKSDRSKFASTAFSNSG